ncbi:MAG: type II secretion system GspH family protein [Lentisphaeraceae bacterium]|nr:type II secretion system GspH family protein [Lentisphaeraceae bacterium]
MKKFTLLELLLVVATVSILISLLLPSIEKARGKAKNAVCMHNEKELGYVLIKQTKRKCDTTWGQNWARANRKKAGQFPYYRMWEYFAFDQDKAEAKDFVKAVACPLVPLPTNVDTKNPYSITRPIMKSWYLKVDSPSEKIALGEKQVITSLPISNRLKEITDDRHFIGPKGTSNVLMVDGHVESGYYLQYVDQESGPHF